MVLAISAIHSYSDPEYLMIMQELRKLGIAPSGNKSIDKSRLEEAKIHLVQKIQTKQAEEAKASINIRPIEGVLDSQNSERAQMEQSRLGAMTVAELNRLYFGI